MLNLGLSIGTIALFLQEDQEGIPVAYTIELNPVYTNESGTTYTTESGANYTIELPPVYVSEDGSQTYTTEG